ncbi:MAG: flagellar hook-basal body complex protein [Phycisphaerae bacterium]|nr:flagellar hook-basal body complex protein [Phycisphaerae bacterium]
MPAKRLLSPRHTLVPVILTVSVVALGLAGCTPYLPSGTTKPTGPSTTDTRVAPAGSGVAMLDLFGDWFYVLRTADGDAVFTQRGDFELRGDGKLVYDDAYVVQGFRADDEGELLTDKFRDLKIDIGQPSPVRATTRVQLKGNVNPDDSDVGDKVATSIKVFDDAGKATTIYIAAVVTGKDADGTDLRFDVRLKASNGTLIARATFRFDADGDVDGLSILQISNASPQLDFDLELDKVTTSSRKDTSLALGSQDGYGTGKLQSYTIGNDGAITGKFSNGLKLLLGQFVIASFTSPEDLGPLPGRSDLFTATDASGQPKPAVSVAE